MATLTALAERVRGELGDLGKSFVHQFTADGTTNRFQIPHAPVDGLTLVVKIGAADVSSTVEVEEHTGYITFDSIPISGAVVTVAGTHFRYFTEAEIQDFVTQATAQHVAHATNAFGQPVTMKTLPMVEEYPLVLLATTMALYTLATDASFDIDISAPDGVMIPRSERYRQVMDMVAQRREQYRELCTQLGIGLYRIEVHTLRRKSFLTNRYVPVYQPQEIDDKSVPVRVYLPMPTYGASPVPSTAVQQDLYIYAGDDYTVDIKFGFDITDYTPKSVIAAYRGSDIPLAIFTLAKIQAVGETVTQTLRMTLTATQTRKLPNAAVWDVQLTDSDGKPHTYVAGRVLVTPEVTQ